MNLCLNRKPPTGSGHSESAEGRLSSRLSTFEFSGLPEACAALVLLSHFPTASCHHSDLILEFSPTHCFPEYARPAPAFGPFFLVVPSAWKFSSPESHLTTPPPPSCLCPNVSFLVRTIPNILIQIATCTSPLPPRHS